MRYLSTAILFAIFFSLFAQNNEEELAGQYFGSGDYEKAAVLYRKLQRNNPTSLYLYENYLQTLIALSDQKEAESLVKKQLKHYPNIPTFQVDLGYVYQLFEEKDKAEKHFESLVKTNQQDYRSCLLVSQAFIKREMDNWAIKMLESGIKQQGPEQLSPKLLNLYNHVGDFEKLVDLSLEVLGLDPFNINNISTHFNIALREHPEAAQYMEQKTLLAVQKNPGKQEYEELLMLVYTMQSKFEAAYRQALSIHKRNKEDGRRLLSLAELCINNKAYDIALKCFESVKLEGKFSVFYLEAELGFLNTLYLKTTSDYSPRSDDIALLISRHELFLEEQGLQNSSAPGARRLAELYLFYQYDIDKAIALLNQVILLQRLSPLFLGQCKLLLGDAYLMMGDIWEAKLLYGQVDKAFKEDVLGQEAKFKQAKLSYFTGDFEWAKQQLDILKTATSQLISNNAISLSLLILENTGLDSTEEAMQEYAKAEFFLYRNRLDECMEILNLIPFRYPKHSLEDEIYFLKARVMEKKGQFIKALEFYEKVYALFWQDILADNALFASAEINYKVLGDNTKSFQLYEKLILDYPSSLFVVEARKMYAILKSEIMQ